MIDPKILKENPKAIREMLERRKVSYPLDELLELDGKRRSIIWQCRRSSSHHVIYSSIEN